MSFDGSLPVPIPAAAAESAQRGQHEVFSDAELVSECQKRYSAVYLLLGYGNKGGYRDFAASLHQLGDVVQMLNEGHGRGKWAIMFGGDTYNSVFKDIAALAKWLKDTHGVPLVAVQADLCKQSAPVDDHVDLVYYYPTQRSTSGKILWSGFLP